MNRIDTHFAMAIEDWQRLADLPWHISLDEWGAHSVELLVIRRGDSRHPVVFVQRQGVRYAIKETTPRMAELEIRNLYEIERRGIPALSPVGTVTVALPPIALDGPSFGGSKQYMNGDRGYTVTRLAARVIPHVLLYRLPLTRLTKRKLLSAVAVLMIELHEHGIYWGDPSLANALIRINGKRILAVMADAETAELVPGALSAGLREQDIAQFGESLAWQAEDMRIARGLPEETSVLDNGDFRYFQQRYRVLRREHARITDPLAFDTLYQAQKFLAALNRLGFSLVSMAGQTVQQFTTVRPGWYQRRIHELTHVTIPRLYARRFYNLLLGHQVLASQREKRALSIEEAAQDWYQRYHLPTILLLSQRLTSEQDPMEAYFAIMDHKWKLSLKAGYEVPLEEAITDWGMLRVDTGKLGAVDPAVVATWWHDREMVADALETPLITSEELDPLLATAERPLVHLQPPELEQQLPALLALTETTDRVASTKDEKLLDER